MLKGTIMRAAAALLVTASLAGTALAGGGKPDDPGKSESAPGQVKQEQQPAQAAAQSEATAPKAEEKQAEKAATTQPKTDRRSNAPIQSAAKGVKPSNTTQKDTRTTVGASPDVSKRYGNGKTAAEVAASQGAPGSAELRGPGNSQPHKIQACPGGKRWVDVHAYKAQNRKCAQPTTPTATTTVTSGCPQTVTQTTTQVVGVLHKGKLKTNPKSAHFSKHGDQQVTATVTETRAVQGECEQQSPATTQQQTAAAPQEMQGVAKAEQQPAGGVAGERATLNAQAAAERPTSGVLGAVGRIGRAAGGAELPFTGLPLGIAALIALGLIGAGVAVRRTT